MQRINAEPGPTACQASNWGSGGTGRLAASARPVIAKEQRAPSADLIDGKTPGSARALREL